MKDVTIYTDGSCLGNPGPGGYGVILMCDTDNGVVKKELSAGYRRTTNNRMELLAAIEALGKLRYPCRVSLYSDSQYLCKAFNEHWIDSWIKKDFRDVKNTDLWKRLLSEVSKHSVTFNWVKGHADNEFNARCDELARTAAASSELLEDEAYS